MRKHDDIERVSRTCHSVEPADCMLQLGDSDQLPRRKSADGDDQTRTQQQELAVEVLRTVRDFDGVRYAVASRLRVAAGEAADHRTDVNARAEFSLIDPEVVGEPGEKTFACGPCERPSEVELPRTRRLTDEHHLSASDCARHRATRDRRTKAACVETLQVSCKW